MNLRETGCEVMGWILLAHNINQLQSLVNTVIN